MPISYHEGELEVQARDGRARGIERPRLLSACVALLPEPALNAQCRFPLVVRPSRSLMYSQTLLLQLSLDLAEPLLLLGDIFHALHDRLQILPRRFMRAVHVSPDEVVAAHDALGARTSVGMHFGTFPLADDGETEAVETLRRALPDGHEDFWVLDIGEGRDVL